MHFQLYLLVYTHLFAIYFSNAFNITTILSQYPSFSIFNRYLSETNVSSEINSRQTITVLAVSNDDVWRLSGKQHDMLDNLMRVHVVLDYYDVEKLQNLQNGTTQMTTLFQTTGRALGKQGFLKVTVSKPGNVVIGSATSGVPVGAILVNSVAAEPFNISVLHITTEIVPVGMNFPVVSNSHSSSPVGPPSPSSKTSRPPPCSHKVAPSHARSSAPSPNTHGESPSESTPIGAPSRGSANAPTSAEPPPLLAPKLVPSQSRSPIPTPNPPPTAKSPRGPSPDAPTLPKSPPAGAPVGGSANAPTLPKSPPAHAPVGGSANAPTLPKSPPAGAPVANAPTLPKFPPAHAPVGGSANAPTSQKSPPTHAPVGGFANAPTLPKSPPAGAPVGGSTNAPTLPKSPPESKNSPPPEGAAPTAAPSGSSAYTPKSPPKSIDKTPRSPPNLADTQPPPKPTDTHRSESRAYNSSLVVVIVMVLSCTNLIIQS